MRVPFPLHSYVNLYLPIHLSIRYYPGRYMWFSRVEPHKVCSRWALCLHLRSSTAPWFLCKKKKSVYRWAEEADGFVQKKSCFVRFYLSLSLLTSGREHHGFCLGESWVFPPIKTIMIFGAPPTRQSLRCNLLSKQIRQKAIGKGFLAVVFYTLVCYEIHMVQGCVLSMK